jgi:hypothetical protein
MWNGLMWIRIGTERDVVNMVLNLQIPFKAGTLLSVVT